MRAAVLAPGPSLARLESMPPCDVSVSINRAILRFPGSTVWAVTDYPVIRNHCELFGTAPRILTRRQTYADVRHRLARFPAVVLVEDVRPAPDGTAWQLKTLTCAMVFAGSLGATAVDVYGCDWSGTEDYDGAAAGEDRSPERW